MDSTVRSSLDATQSALVASRVVSLLSMDIEQIGSGEGAELDSGVALGSSPPGRYSVTTIFRADVGTGLGSPLVIKADFSSDAQAMSFVLGLFSLLEALGVATRSDVVGWRRDLLVAV